MKNKNEETLLEEKLVEESAEEKTIKKVEVKQPNTFKIYHNKPVPQPPEEDDADENEIKRYKKNHTEYEYMTPKDFDAWRDNHKVKVVANVKPWQKYKENRKDNKRKGCLKDELIINKDDENTYKYNLYKNSNQKCKGYIYVGENNYIRMEKLDRRK